MALQKLPGVASGFIFKKYSSFNEGKAVGKLTDSNHLYSLQMTDPVDYDKKIITLYSQSSLYSNDFLNMINAADPFYIERGDAWKWEMEVPYQFPKIIEVPASTWNQARIGIDGQEFEIVLDRNDFFANEVITSHRMYGQQFALITDGQPYNSGYLFKATLVSANPKVEFVDKKFLLQGVEYSSVGTSIGEFDQDLPGLPSMGDRIVMFESMGAGSSREHTITGWADAMSLSKAGISSLERDQAGAPLDLLVFAKRRRNELPTSRNDVRWEPFIEFWLRKTMLEDKVRKMMWAKPGTIKTRGSKQEIKKFSAGIIHRMRTSGNYVPYNKGDFSVGLLRAVFGDLFYRRVPMSKRRVKMYTNEAGLDIFENAIKQDAMNSGLSFVVDGSDRFVQGQGRNLVYNFAFSSMITRETGKIEVVHLSELDQPQSNLEFGQNLKSTPIFIVFDVSPESDGSMKSNIREVRVKGQPSMTWGYIDGRRHHLGFAASQGMSSANKFNGYTIFMDDRYDVFIEDMTRCVLIEEIPQY